MRKVILLLIFVYLCFSARYVSAQNVVTVRVAEFPPVYFKDEEGHWTGLSVELAEAIILAAGLKPEWVELPWSRALLQLKQGNLMYMTNLYNTESRSMFLHWVGPLRVSKMSLFVQQENKSLDITTLDDFITVCHEQKKQFGIQRDIKYPDAFVLRMSDDSEFRNCFEVVPNVSFNIKKTAKNRILGFFESGFEMEYQIRTDPEFTNLVAHPFVFSSESSTLFHGVSKKAVSLELLKKLQDGYVQCIEDGTIRRIVQKWNIQ